MNHSLAELTHTRQSELVRMVINLEAQNDWLIDQLLDRWACSENLRNDDGYKCTKVENCKQCWQEMTEWAVNNAVQKS